MTKAKSNNGDHFADGKVDPEELLRFGIETTFNLTCLIMASSLALKDRVRTVRVREEENGKTHSIWFQDGGTVELFVNDKNEVEMIDSFGCDVSFAWNRVEFSSHQPDPGSPRYDAADRDYEGPVNSQELFENAFKKPFPYIPNDD